MHETPTDAPLLNLKFGVTMKLPRATWHPVLYLTVCPHGASSWLEDKIHKIHICTVLSWLLFEKIQ